MRIISRRVDRVFRHTFSEQANAQANKEMRVLKREETETMFHERRTFQGLRLSVSAALSMLTIFGASMFCFVTFAAAQQPGQKTFSSAMEAGNALVEALQAPDQSALMSILGADGKDVVSSGDPVEDKNDRAQFIQKYQQMHRMVLEPNGKTTLYIGAENWPTPIPLVHKGNQWYFDTPTGKQEILYRRIGKNELAVIQVCRELVDAQKEYYAQPHDGAGDSQYAQKLFSDPGKQNGLYWKAAPGEPESPIGPLVAAAAAEGYTEAADMKPQPFQGYYFRILTGPAAKTSGGARSYLVDGKMTRGFAFLAYPAEYRASGIMTFIVDQHGIVYEKDLGRHTAEAAKAIKGFGYDSTWRKAD